MQANTNLNFTELDFDGIKNSLKSYLKTQDVFTDYDFDSSALNILLGVLSYNTAYNAFYMNMLSSEMFLDSATLRSSVISHIKNLDYLPRSSSSSIATIDIQFNDVTDSSVILPIYTKFISEAINGKNYVFVTTKSHVSNVVDNIAKFSDIEISEGIPVIEYKYTFTNSGKKIFKIPDPNVDIKSLIVKVYQSSNDVNFDIYNISENYISLNSESLVYFLQESLDGYYEIYFGDGVLGKSLIDGNVISLSYIISNGTNSNGATNFSLLDNIGYPNYSINTKIPAIYGLDKESIDSIKFNSPKYFAAQKRCITPEDYLALINSNLNIFPIESCNVWGGEDNIPPIYGKIFIAIKPINSKNLSSFQKEKFLNDIIYPRCLPTVKKGISIIDVEYNYLNILTNIYYKVNNTNLDKNTLFILLQNSIKLNILSKLNKFNSEFILPDINSIIKDLDKSIITCESNISIQKRFYPKFQINEKYELNFGFPIRKNLYGNSIWNNTTFSLLYNGSIINNVFLEDIPNTTSSINKIKIVNPGYNFSNPPSLEIIGNGSGANAYSQIVNNKISNVIIDKPGDGYTQAYINILNNSGAILIPELATNISTIRAYYYNNGIKTIINNNIGTIDFNNGIITLNINIIDVDNILGILDINVIPESNIISTKNDKMLTLDVDDTNAIRINLIPS